MFLGLCVAGHIFIRITLPHADPYIFPLVAVLACFGLVMVYRIYGATYARQQAQWFVLGLVLFAGDGDRSSGTTASSRTTAT